MRKVLAAVAAGAAMVAAVGCGSGKPFDGPTVDKFDGKLVADGKPVSFPAGTTVTLKVFHQKGESFNIPVNPDGTIKIGWMPVGKYTGQLIREKEGGGGGGKGGSAAPPAGHGIPGFEIKEGQTEYTIELGKGFKP